jgi:hypothetical protein
MVKQFIHHACAVLSFDTMEPIFTHSMALDQLASLIRTYEMNCHKLAVFTLMLPGELRKIEFPSVVRIND